MEGLFYVRLVSRSAARIPKNKVKMCMIASKLSLCWVFRSWVQRMVKNWRTSLGRRWWTASRIFPPTTPRPRSLYQSQLSSTSVTSSAVGEYTQLFDNQV